MMEAAVAGKLKALYVVGANPVKTFGVAQPDRLAGLELLVVHDMFLTETAQRADVVLPAASTYEKDGTLTNTAGEVQMTHRAIDAQGPRSDFDLLRILSHQLGMLGLGTPIKLRTPEAAFDEIRQHVAGYDLSHANLLGGGAELATATLQSPPSRRTTCLPARFFLHTIICLRAAPWAVTVPGSIRRTRQKRRRGVHLPAPSPGGIASQDCRPAVYCNDGLGLSDLVRAESRRAHSVALGPVLRWRARTAPAAGGRPEVPFQGRLHAAGVGQVRLHARAVSGAFARADGHRADSFRRRPSVQLLGQPVFIVANSTSACCFCSPSPPWACTAWRWPGGPPTANIR